MSEKTDQILEQLKSISLLEASELVKQIEEAFGVDASASSGGGMMMMPGMMGGAPAAEAEPEEEKTEFDVVLEEVPADKKIAILKVVRGLRMAIFLRSEEHTSELQSRPHNSYAVFCLKKKTGQMTRQQ